MEPSVCSPQERPKRKTSLGYFCCGGPHGAASRRQVSSLGPKKPVQEDLACPHSSVRKLASGLLDIPTSGICQWKGCHLFRCQNSQVYYKLAGEILQRLRALPALTEDLDPFPSTPMAAVTTCNSSSRGPDTFFCIEYICYTYIQATTSHIN